MSSKEISIITSLPLPPLQDRKQLSRREVVKQIGVGALAGSPLVVGSFSHKQIETVLEDPSQFDDVLTVYKRAGKQALRNVGIDVFHSTKNLEEVADIANSLDVRLISTHDAYEMVPLEYKENFSWELSEAKLLQELFNVLPSHFRSRDINNSPLSIALGQESMINKAGDVRIGSYFPGLIDNVMVLAKSRFTPDDPQGSL